MKQLFNYLITGSHLGPYWYIPVILIFFLLSPIIIYFKKFIAFRYFLIATLGYSLLSNRPESYNLIDNILYFFGFFHLGIIMAMYRHAIENWFSKRKVLLYLFITWIVAYSLVLTDVLPQLKTIQLLILGFLLMNVSFSSQNSIFKKVFSLLADYSFGIYFIHQYIINIFASISARLGFNYHDLLYSLIIFPVVIGTSVLIIFITKKAVGNKRSRLLIGA